MKPVLLPIALSAVLLAGCGSAAQATGSSTTAGATPSVTSSATPTPKPSPTPTVMSDQQAGKLYTSVICPSNASSITANNTVNRVPFDLPASRKAVAALRDSYRRVIERFTAKGTIWPTQVKADVNTFVDGLYTELTQAGDVANQDNQQAFISSWNAWTDPNKPNPDGTAAQKIRVKLGLSSDAMTSCGLK